MPRPIGVGAINPSSNILTQDLDDNHANSGIALQDLSLDHFDCAGSELSRQQRAAIAVVPKRVESEEWRGHCDTSDRLANVRFKNAHLLPVDWNYPLDRNSVKELEGPPARFDVSTLPQGGKVKFYQMELKYTRELVPGAEHSHTYEYWIQHDDAGKPINTGWVNSEARPDFLWVPKK